MKLLKINTSQNEKKRFMSLFECPVCGDKIERITGDGYKQKRCCGGKSKYAPKGSKLHNKYIGMTQRCWDKNAINYKNYGGRGIAVCKSWRNFDNFAKWALSNGYSDGLQIDRIDNDGNYEPSNCRFVTRSENMRNTRMNITNMEEVREIRKDHKSGKYKVIELVDKYGICKSTMEGIIYNYNWREV